MSQQNSANSRSSGVVQKQSLNVYTVMLIVAFCAISIASLLLYLELRKWGSYPWWKANSGTATSYIYRTEGPELPVVSLKSDASRWWS